MAESRGSWKDLSKEMGGQKDFRLAFPEAEKGKIENGTS